MIVWKEMLGGTIVKASEMWPYKNEEEEIHLLYCCLLT